MQTPPTEYSNYPRHNLGQPGSRPPGVYFDTIGIAFRMISTEWAVWIASSLLFFLVTILAYIPTIAISNKINYGVWFTLDPEPEVRVYIVNFLTGLPFTAIFTGLIVGLATMAIRQSRGEEISPGMIFLGWRNPFHIFATAVIVNITVTLGFVCCILPGVYAAGVLCLAVLLPSLQDVDGAEALRRSYVALRPFALPMFALCFVAYLVAVSGFLACGIGLFFTLPVLSIVLGLHYTYFFPAPGNDFLFQPIGEAPPI